MATRVQVRVIIISNNNDYNNDYYLLIIIIISGSERGGDAGAVSGGRGPVCQGVRPVAGG